LPSNYSLYDTLTSDTTLQLIDRPIDEEVILQGDYYHDPAIPDTLPTYQYTAVPVDYTPPPGINFETIEELYLPKEDTTMQEPGGRISSEYEQFVDELEYEALNLTGNLDERHKKTNNGGRTEGLLPSKWWPAGRIRVWDNRLNQYIGIAGARVEARRWFEVNTGLTNANGYFKMDDWFRYDANYSIPWERPDFVLRSGTFVEAMFNGPNMKGDWNLDIQRNGISWTYAHVFRGAVRYFYGDIGGLTRPKVYPKLKYAVYDFRAPTKYDARNIGNWSVNGFNFNIQLFRYNSDGYEFYADELFSTTCHETAHTTHWQVMNAGALQYIQLSETIRESWAVGVEWFITQKEYRERGIANYSGPTYNVSASYPIWYGYQYWPLNGSYHEYSCVFIDLIDNYNQLGQPFLNIGTSGVNDPVTGYTLAGIESGFLKHVYGLNSLRERLKANKPTGVTDSQIDILINNF
jgi:hypothetical protein